MNEITIKIKIAFNRKELEPFVVPFTTAEEIFFIIKEKLLEQGLAEIKEHEFYTYDGTKIDRDNIISHISDGVLYIVYNNIVPPYGAYEYDRQDGIVFYFHTAEAPHRNFPHIHARYSGENISIYLSEYRTVGHFSNRKKEKLAVEYVVEKKEELLQKWNELIQQ